MDLATVFPTSVVFFLCGYFVCQFVTKTRMDEERHKLEEGWEALQAERKKWADFRMRHDERPS